MVIKILLVTLHIHDLMISLTHIIMQIKREKCKRMVKIRSADVDTIIPKGKTRVSNTLLTTHFSPQLRQKKGQQRNRVVRSNKRSSEMHWPITAAKGKTVVGCLAEERSLFVETRKTVLTWLSASRNCKRVHPSRCIKFISSDSVDFSRCAGHWRERCHVPRISVRCVGFIFRLMSFSYIPRYVAKKRSHSRNSFRKLPVGIRDEFWKLHDIYKNVA